MSAISEIAGCFAQNISHIENYGKRIEAGELATYRGYQMTSDDLIRQRAILDLMCNFHLSFKGMDERFDFDSRRYFSLELNELEPFIDDGVVAISDDGVDVLPAGRIFVRNVAMVFDIYLRNKREEGIPLFSRTI